jgi:anti-sigma factor RsiW
MKKFSDEMLMAYADGELDLVARAEIEAAIARDPEVARAVERHRALADHVHTAYDGVLEEPVPDRLAALVAPSGGAPVADLSARREATRIAIGRWQIPAVYGTRGVGRTRPRHRDARHARANGAL